MRTKLPGISPISDYGRRLKRTHEMKILRRNISVLHGRKAGSDKKISQFKLDLRETFGMSGNFIENTVKWLRKKVRNKVQKVKVRLKRKYKFLLEEKMKLDDIWRKRREDTKKNNAGKGKLDSRCEKKVVYSNSSRVLSDKEIELLSLRLNV